MGVQPLFSHFQFPRSRPVSCQTGDRPPGPSAGFTILEVLVAMVVASIMVMIITPPVFLVTAARVQQRRAQQSLQLAQAEIDRVRTTVERGVYTVDDLPTAAGNNLNAVPAATGVASQLKSTNSSCNTYRGDRLDSTQFLPIDINGDCQSDFLLQSVRTNGPTGTAVPVTGFQMVARVYVDLPLVRQNIGQLNTTPARLAFSTGIGTAAVQPLAVLQSTIARPDTSNALQNYRTLCENGGC